MVAQHAGKQLVLFIDIVCMPVDHPETPATTCIIIAGPNPSSLYFINKVSNLSYMLHCAAGEPG